VRRAGFFRSGSLQQVDSHSGDRAVLGSPAEGSLASTARGRIHTGVDDRSVPASHGARDAGDLPTPEGVRERGHSRWWREMHGSARHWGESCSGQSSELRNVDVGRRPRRGWWLEFPERCGSGRCEPQSRFRSGARSDVCHRSPPHSRSLRRSVHGLSSTAGHSPTPPDTRGDQRCRTRRGGRRRASPVRFDDAQAAQCVNP
jgi:hypothetical protein